MTDEMIQVQQAMPKLQEPPRKFALITNFNIADKVIMVAGGKIAAEGSKEEVLPKLFGTISGGCRVTEVNG